MKKILRPYWFISACGLIGFAPVSFMIRALKNDIIALEYPINHFINQCVRQGELPYWFNTWGAGFPLHSNLTWGIFSTPQLLFGSLFNYNIYTLHIEFLFFILLSGWSMFYLLKKHFLQDEKMAQLLAICYMLSGFIAGSTQWLLYITAAAFIPVLIASLLQLLDSPSFKRAIQFAICYTLMFTSVYAAFNIITSYSLVFFVVIYLLWKRKEADPNPRRFLYLLLAGGLTFLLCLPCLYFTLELLNHIDRGSSLAVDSSFFNSNYLHPFALSSLLFPFSSVRMSFANTEGTMLDTYSGLFVLLLLPGAGWLALKQKNKPALAMLGVALFFLLAAFGPITPVRQGLNVLPGLSYFRNPAIFRLYFIMSLIFFLAIVSGNRSLEEWLDRKNSGVARLVHACMWLAGGLCLFVIFRNRESISTLSFDSLTRFIKGLTLSQALLISSVVQFFLIALLIALTRLKKWTIARYLLATDLVINTLACTPYFSVSSYSLPEVNRILKSGEGFPLQQDKPADVKTIFRDHRGNSWYNVNTFSKEVSVQDSYWGPLVLKKSLTNTKGYSTKLLVFAHSDSAQADPSLLLQRPAHVRVKTNFTEPTPLTLQQNNYPGWKVYVNGIRSPIVICYSPEGKPKMQFTEGGITVLVPPGEATVDFRYERKGVWMSALLLHLIVLFFCCWKLVRFIRRTNRSSSPS